ncbi:hypothetical protein GE061_007735 [Apolygus lucorum]|uniref:Uncharacterized protein n=1 Tax=Apolygus lucorum TaxID=248454 RepID=A0A6A4IZR3_APOLU|nr:hypothetical protein GE061_007735 [Apolygus lucorum]
MLSTRPSTRQSESRESQRVAPPGGGGLSNEPPPPAAFFPPADRLPPSVTPCAMYTSQRPPTPYRGPSALLEESPNIKCPICTDQGFSIVTLECGHLIPTPDPRRSPPESEEEFKRPPRTPCGRLSRRGPLGKQFVPPPEVVVQRVELVQRSAPPLTSSRPHLRPKKKKESTPEPQPPDPRENGRILGSKVLPLMALLLRKADEDDDDNENEVQEEAKPPVKEEKNGKRKLTIQCVQLLPDAEAMPVKPGASRHFCHR